MSYLRSFTVIGLLITFLTGCATTYPKGNVVEVQWLRAKSLKEVERMCNITDIYGCQWFEGNRCIVVAMDYGGKTLNTLGHELKHCYDGKWHLY